MFYQGYNGNLLEYRINRTGGRGLVNVNNVPENTSRNVIAPAMGTSLATVMSGEDGQTVYLFYQAEDNVSPWVIPAMRATANGPLLYRESVRLLSSINRLGY